LSIQKLHTGRYYIRWNEGGKKRGRTFDRRRDAEKFEAEVRRRKAMGGLVIIPERVSLSELQERYIAFLEEKGREKNTMDGYAAMWKHLDKELGHAPVHEITPATVEALGPKMIRKGVGATSACKALGMLSAMMNRAIVWGYIDRNPCQHVERPKVTRKRQIVLSPSEVEKIRSKMSHRDRTLVSVLSLAGLRPGEALALRWGDISGRTIRVDKAVAHGEAKSTKNEKDRSVRLLPSLKQDLLEWKLASGRPGDSQLVFPNGRGELWTDAKFRNWRTKYFDPAARGAGFPDVTPYTMRHSFASLLLASGAGLPETAYEMGHTVGVLTSTYAHAIAEFRGAGRIDPETTVGIARGRDSSAEQTA
jgi:integrase